MAPRVWRSASLSASPVAPDEGEVPHTSLSLQQVPEVSEVFTPGTSSDLFVDPETDGLIARLLQDEEDAHIARALSSGNNRLDYELQRRLNRI